MPTRKKVWWRELILLIVGTIMGGVVVAIINEVFLSKSQTVNNPPPAVVNPQPAPFELITRADLEKAVREAKSKIEATGYVLKVIDPDFISSKMSDSTKFTAKIVMVDPLGSNKMICHRQYDEDNKARAYEQILLRVKEFKQKNEKAFGGRLQVGLADFYPTMAIIIVDDTDLYAYFYPYKGLGTNSPVIKFSNYNKDERAKFFESHLRRVFEQTSTRFLSTDADYDRYLSANLHDPCFQR